MYYKNKFFIDGGNFNRALSNPEQQIKIKMSFPNAKAEDMKFLAIGGLLVKPTYNVNHYRLSIEEIKEIKEISDTHNTVTELHPLTFEIPIELIAHNFVNNICSSEFTCLPRDYSQAEQGGFNPGSLYMTYNCVGWALGIQAWVNPLEGKIKNFKDDTKLEKLVGRYMDSKYYAYEDTYMVNKQDKSLKIECNKILDNKLIEKEGSIAFYFDVNKMEMTHAARYIEAYKSVSIESWTSKLGQDILVTHALDDLIDGYGSPLCFAYKFNHTSEGHDEL